MNFEEKQRLVCAKALGIEPERIARIDTIVGGNGHFEGLDVVVHIPTGRHLGKYIEEQFAQEPQARHL